MVVDSSGRFLTQRQEPKLAHIVPYLPPSALFGDGDPSPIDAFMSEIPTTLPHVMPKKLSTP